MEEQCCGMLMVVSAKNVRISHPVMQCQKGTSLLKNYPTLVIREFRGTLLTAASVDAALANDGQGLILAFALPKPRF
ncbi:MAG: hypothetical protein M3014_15270 [Chloroflexota bacterium]|nr:hypothetical protein [Chloroflexota bacterium]